MRVSILLWNIHSFKSLRRRHPSAHLIVQDRFSFCPRGFSRSWLWCSDDLFLKDFSAAATASCQRTKTDVLNASFRLTRNRLQQHFKFFHLFLCPQTVSFHCFIFSLKMKQLGQWWWWTIGQQTPFLLWWSEFESGWKLQFLFSKWFDTKGKGAGHGPFKKVGNDSLNMSLQNPLYVFYCI